MPRITDYPPSTVFALNPNFDLDTLKEGHKTGTLNRDRLVWLGLKGRSKDEITSTQNPYKEHPDYPSPLKHVGYDFRKGRIIAK